MANPVKNPNDLSLVKELTTQPKRRTLRDIDDFQSYMFPDVTAQEFVDGLKSGKVLYPSNVDTGARENLDTAVMSELGLSPRAYNDILKEYNKNFKPQGDIKNGAGEYFEDFMKKFDDWDKAGRPKTDDGDWAHDFSSNYAPNGFLRWYRPEDQWGKADHIRARSEWDDKFGLKGIHKEYDPYQSGYETARKYWSDFLTGPYGSMANPKFKEVLEWLDKNKEYI